MKKVAIIQETSKDVFKEKLNNANKKLDIFATQTHIVMMKEHLVYVAVIYYKVHNQQRG